MSDKRKHVCVIYTGGTIGMARSPQGYFPDAAVFRSVMERLRGAVRR